MARIALLAALTAGASATKLCSKVFEVGPFDTTLTYPCPTTTPSALVGRATDDLNTKTTTVTPDTSTVTSTPETSLETSTPIPTPIVTPIVKVSVSPHVDVTVLTTPSLPTITPSTTVRGQAKKVVSNSIWVPSLGIMDAGFVGSVQKADPCSTTLVLECDKAAVTPNEMCEEDVKFKVSDSLARPSKHHANTILQATMTKGTSDYQMKFTTKRDGVTARGREGCDIYDDTWWKFPGAPSDLAVCTWVGGGDPKEVDTVDASERVMIPITAGAKKLPKADAICTKTDEAGAAMPTGILEIKKVIVPLVLAAGAQAML